MLAGFKSRCRMRSCRLWQAMRLLAICRKTCQINFSDMNFFCCKWRSMICDRSPFSQYSITMYLVKA
jgi:hypothetical protein